MLYRANYDGDSPHHHDCAHNAKWCHNAHPPAIKKCLHHILCGILCMVSRGEVSPNNVQRAHCNARCSGLNVILKCELLIILISCCARDDWCICALALLFVPLCSHILIVYIRSLCIQRITHIEGINLLLCGLLCDP